MDSPEDIEANPVTGRVYAVMTKNNSRLPFNLNAANPRWWNHYGHILELSPRGGVGRDADHTGDVYDWAVFVLAGNHRNWLHGATFHTATSENGWFVNPDNLAFDPKGRLFVATDGGNEFGIPDGIYGMATEGPDRGLSKLLFSCPVGAEASGPCFTSDGKTLFVSVQGPGAKTHWPDFKAEGPSRPAVVAIQRLDGGDIGG
jgi:secreted PhoX family phosphatase